jgi:hypothetical protein
MGPQKWINIANIAETNRRYTFLEYSVLISDGSLGRGREFCGFRRQLKEVFLDSDSVIPSFLHSRVMPPNDASAHSDSIVNKSKTGMSHGTIHDSSGIHFLSPPSQMQRASLSISVVPSSPNHRNSRHRTLRHANAWSASPNRP